MIPLGTKAGPVQSPFSPEQQKRFEQGFEEAVAKYPAERRKAALLAVLHLVQDELGWLTEPAMAYVGHLLDVPPVRVREVATFYTMYRLRPVGRHHIGVCNSTAISRSKRWPASQPAAWRRRCWSTISPMSKA